MGNWSPCHNRRRSRSRLIELPQLSREREQRIMRSRASTFQPLTFRRSIAARSRGPLLANLGADRGVCNGWLARTTIGNER